MNGPPEDYPHPWMALPEWRWRSIERAAREAATYLKLRESDANQGVREIVVALESFAAEIRGMKNCSGLL